MQSAECRIVVAGLFECRMQSAECRIVVALYRLNKIKYLPQKEVSHTL